VWTERVVWNEGVEWVHKVADRHEAVLVTLHVCHLLSDQYLRHVRFELDLLGLLLDYDLLFLNFLLFFPLWLFFLVLLLNF